MLFGYGIGALVWAVSRKRPGNNHRCTEAFGNFIDSLCADRSVAQFERIGDGQPITITLDD